MKITIKNNNRNYVPNKIYTKTETYDLKPGFKKQMKNFIFQTKKNKINELENTNKLIKHILK